MCPSRVAEGGQRGWIVPIGGAEDKENDRRVLRRFFELCGGEGAEIAVIPTASRLNETGGRYEQIFGGMGARNVSVLDFDTRRDAHERNRIARIEQASGIFITGGNQLRLSTILGGTPVAQAIRACNAQGIPVGGTSAGAGILSEHMIAGGESENPTPRANSVKLAPGDYHLMLTHPTRALKPGDTVPVTLHFAGGGELQVNFSVLPANSTGPAD